MCRCQPLRSCGSASAEQLPVNIKRRVQNPLNHDSIFMISIVDSVTSMREQPQIGSKVVAKHTHSRVLGD